MANIDLEVAEGKKLITSIENWGEYLLIFEGGEVVVLSAQGGDYDDDPAVVEDEFFLSNWLRYADLLIEHGVVTQEQVSADKEKKIESKRKELEAKRLEVERLERELSGQ